jgi:hypothetical protein
MIHARDDYNRIQDPDGKIGEDEPVFLIRARDRTAAAVVLYWSDLNREKGQDNTLSDLAAEHANRIREWQKKNGCKRSDL